jgi:hypothetical protein
VRDEVASGSDKAQAFYEERLKTSQDALQKAQRDQAIYQPPAGSNVSTDPVAVSLRLKVQQAQDEYTSILSTLQQIDFDRQAALSGKDVAFRVMDAPNLPASAGAVTLQSRAVMPAVGILFGLALAGGLLVALARLDDSLRVAEDAPTFGVPVLAVLPDLGVKREAAWPQNFVRVAMVFSKGVSRSVRYAP